MAVLHLLQMHLAPQPLLHLQVLVRVLLLLQQPPGLLA
jgi:hypothetical protein